MSATPRKKQKTLPADTGALLTLRDWLRYAVSLFRREKLFFGQGCASAYDEAVVLLQHALALPAEGLETFLDARLTESEIEKIKNYLCRRAFEREPAAYITGEAHLGEFTFRVDKRVIVPRSYFLEIIPEQLNQWLRDPEGTARVADVCTGSGCLAILLAHAYPNAHVDATDLSADALAVARENVSDYQLQNRISLYRSDVLAGVPRDGAPYDVIVCNPPYEPKSVLKTLPAEFRHEPENALVSGADGLDVIRKLLPEAAERLAENGILLIEVGGLHDAMEAAWPALEIHWLATHDESDCVALIHATALRKLFSGKHVRSQRQRENRCR